jgi:diguanylate cyclase (GGDEF)-like protein
MKLTYKTILIFVLLIVLVSAANTYSTLYLLKNLQTERLKTAEVLFARSLSNRLYRAVIEEKINKITDVLFEEKNLREEKIEYIIVVDKKGYLLAHTYLNNMPKKLLKINNTFPKEKQYRLEKIEDKKLSVYNIAVPVMEGIKQVGTIHIGIRSDYVQNIITPTKKASTSSMVITLIITLIAVVIAIPLTHTISKPLLRLKKLTEKISRGELEAQIDIKTGDEIGDLANAFNRMTNDLHVTITSRDREIIDRKKAEELLSQSKQDWEDTFDLITDVVTVHDKDFNLIRANRSAQEILKLPLLTKETVKCFKYYHGSDAPPAGCPSCDCLKTGKPAAFELFEPHLNKFIEIRAIPRLDGDNNVIGLIHVVRDITKRKQTEKQLERQAYYDQLTNLSNRSLFTKYLEHMIAKTKRHKDNLFAVLFIDLDRFKVINDSLGHIIGDQLLVSVARRLEVCIRPEDIISRFGGDEFALLLDNITDINDAIHIADRIQEGLSLPFNLGEHEVFTTASIGIALSATGYDKEADIIRDADAAMYRAKALGRARYEIFDSQMHASAMKLLQLEADLRRAVDRNEFVVHYQPIVSLINGRITGAEALIRWEHPDQGEETGLISRIGEWILREACVQNKEWYDAGHRHLNIGVNFSARQFQYQDLYRENNK